MIKKLLAKDYYNQSFEFVVYVLYFLPDCLRF